MGQCREWLLVAPVAPRLAPVKWRFTAGADRSVGVAPGDKVVVWTDARRSRGGRLIGVGDVEDVIEATYLPGYVQLALVCMPPPEGRMLEWPQMDAAGLGGLPYGDPGAWPLPPGSADLVRSLMRTGPKAPPPDTARNLYLEAESVKRAAQLKRRTKPRSPTWRSTNPFIPGRGKNW